MALPNRKHSRTRRDRRRTHVKLSPLLLSKCPQCDHKRISHRVCPFCGYYDGKKIVATHEEVLTAREDKKKKKLVKK